MKVALENMVEKHEPDWLCFWHYSRNPTLESIPYFIISPLCRYWQQHTENLWEPWSHHPKTSSLSTSPVNTGWATTQAKNMSPFLSSHFFFFLHVRALLGAAGPGHYRSWNPPSCKVVRCQTSSDLQLWAHAISLLLWVIKGKWEHSVQILPVILTCILSRRAAARIDPNHMVKGGKHGIMGKAGAMEGCNRAAERSIPLSLSASQHWPRMIPILRYENFTQKYQTIL